MKRGSSVTSRIAKSGPVNAARSLALWNSASASTRPASSPRNSSTTMKTPSTGAILRHSAALDLGDGMRADAPQGGDLPGVQVGVRGFEAKATAAHGGNGVARVRARPSSRIGCSHGGLGHDRGPGTVHALAHLHHPQPAAEKTRDDQLAVLLMLLAFAWDIGPRLLRLKVADPLRPGHELAVLLDRREMAR